MKIDVEGADKICLNTLAQWDEKPNYVSFEIGVSPERSYDGVLEDISLLEHLGYSEFMAISQESVPFQQVPDVPKEGVYVWHMFPAGSSGLFGKELPGKWRSKDEILKECRTITDTYDRFGPFTFWHRKRGAKRLFKIMNDVVSYGGLSLLDWYDIHAKHSSVAN